MAHIVCSFFTVLILWWINTTTQWSVKTDVISVFKKLMIRVYFLHVCNNITISTTFMSKLSKTPSILTITLLNLFVDIINLILDFLEIFELHNCKIIPYSTFSTSYIDPGIKRQASHFFLTFAFPRKQRSLVSWIWFKCFR